MLSEIILTEFQFARWWELWGLSLPFSPLSDHQESKWWHSSTRTRKDLTILQHKLDWRNWNITMSVSSKYKLLRDMLVQNQILLKAPLPPLIHTITIHTHTFRIRSLAWQIFTKKNWIASCFHFCQLGCEVSFGIILHMKSRLKNQHLKSNYVRTLKSYFYSNHFGCKPFVRKALKKLPFKLDSNSLASGPCALAQPWPLTRSTLVKTQQDSCSSKYMVLVLLKSKTLCLALCPNHNQW